MCVPTIAASQVFSFNFSTTSSPFSLTFNYRRDVDYRFLGVRSKAFSRSKNIFVFRFYLLSFQCSILAYHKQTNRCTLSFFETLLFFPIGCSIVAYFSLLPGFRLLRTRYHYYSISRHETHCCFG